MMIYLRLRTYICMYSLGCLLLPNKFTYWLRFTYSINQFLVNQVNYYWDGGGTKICWHV